MTIDRAEARRTIESLNAVGSQVDRGVRRVVCAAIRADDGSLLLGLRHYSQDMHDQIAARTDGAKFYHRTGGDQGFVDQRGEYLTRTQAWAVAETAGQVRRQGLYGEGVLYSEDLY